MRVPVVLYFGRGVGRFPSGFPAVALGALGWQRGWWMDSLSGACAGMIQRLEAKMPKFMDRFGAHKAQI